MRKFLQLTLVLSCLLIVCSHNINVVGQVDIWTTGHAFEESFTDTDNHDFEGTLAKTNLFTSSLSLEQKKFVFEIDSKNEQLSHGFIRAPPIYTL